MAHIEPLIDAQPAAQIMGLLPVTRGASVPNGSMESHADRTLGDQLLTHNRPPRFWGCFP